MLDSAAEVQESGVVMCTDGLLLCLALVGRRRHCFFGGVSYILRRTKE